MTFKFEPDDFEKTNLIEDPIAAAETAQKIFDEWLESQPNDKHLR